MKVHYLYPDQEGKLTFFKADLEKLLNEVYQEGYSDGWAEGYSSGRSTAPITQPWTPYYYDTIKITCDSTSPRMTIKNDTSSITNNITLGDKK